LRRVYFDLIGLSPSSQDLAAFENDTSADAYEKVVDRLLADPRYGERWARHWMDVWRYSDWAGWTGGNQVRDSKPHIWRWRDWIVESLNNDKGYDQMVVEMLAADEIAPSSAEANAAIAKLFDEVREFAPLLAYAGAVERAADEVPRLTGELAWAREAIAAAETYNADLVAHRDRSDAAAKEYNEDLRANLTRVEGELATAHRALARLSASLPGRLVLRWLRRG